MRFERSVSHLLMGLMAAFGVILASALYWGVLGSDSALASPFNYRQRDALAAVQRGTIFDSNERPLVESVAGEKNTWSRATLDAALPSITGYASLTYGTGGAEAAYNALLTGQASTDALTEQFERDVLHRPQRGADIRLTLDLEIQQAALDALDGHTGAVIVMDATTGELLAIASSPTIDPATLDADWESLIKRPDNPFFNRALQGEYQPGGALQPVLIAGWLISGRAPEENLPLTDGLNAPITVGEATIGCVSSPIDEADSTPIQALLNGCPAGFATMIDTLGETAVTEVLTLFGATQHLELDGFTLPTTANATAETVSDWRADALGQGNLRLSPLDMAVILAGIANDGNAPHPYLLQATRQPDAQDWVPVNPPHQTTPLTTAQTAQAVQSLMIQAVESGTAIGAAQAGLTLGAHIGQAASGEQGLTWFTGFVELTPDRNLVAVILWEGDAPVSDAAQTGGKLLSRAAAEKLND